MGIAANPKAPGGCYIVSAGFRAGVKDACRLTRGVVLSLDVAQVRQ